MKCPTSDELDAILDDDHSIAALEEHVDSCIACQALLAERAEQPQWGRFAPEAAQLDTKIGSSVDKKTVPSGSQRSSGAVRIPGYEVFEQIGRGGMGVVYRARHRRLNRDVAVKFLANAETSSPEAFVRFKTEAEAVARLQHPNIIQIFDSGDSDHGAFVCQELADNQTLADRIDHQPQPSRDSARLVAELANAVQHAHDHAVLHRDLKPSNVLFSGEMPKIADFGLAKLVDSNDEMTKTSDVMGTPGYMAPEQAGGAQEAVGPHTDVYSLGIILYEMLTGSPPFRAASPLGTLQQVLEQEAVPLRRQNSDVPRDLETICHKCLEKEPSSRYDSAKQLASDLENFLEGRPIIARPANWFELVWKWCKRRPAMAALMGFSIMAVTTLLIGWVIFTGKLAAQTNIAINKAEEARLSLIAEKDSHAAALEIVRFLSEDVLDAAVPERTQKSELTVVEALIKSGESIPGKFTERPVVEATLRATIGNSLVALGRPLDAIEHLEQAVAIMEELGEQGETAVAAKRAYASCLIDLDRNQEAQQQLESLLESGWTMDERTSMQVQNNLTMLQTRTGDPQEGIRRQEENVEECARRLGEDHPTTLSARSNLAVKHYQAGQIEKAAALFAKVYEVSLQVNGPTHPDVFSAATNYGVMLAKLNRLDEAEELYRVTLENQLKVFGADHPAIWGTHSNIANLLLRREQYSEAEELLVRIYEKQVERFGVAHLKVLGTMHTLANTYIELHDSPKAAAFLEQQFEPIQDQMANTVEWGLLHLTYGRIRTTLNDKSAARELLLTARSIFEKSAHVQEANWRGLEKAEAALND